MNPMTFQRLTDEVMRLYADGKYADSLRLVEQNADRFPEQTARTTFWKMCLLSLCGRSKDVISVFQHGLDSDLWWAKSQFMDTDLDAVRDLPEFKHLVAKSNSRCLEMQEYIKPNRTLLVPENASTELSLLICLHGRNGHNDSNLEHWKVACQCGWLVLLPQSRQAIYPGAYSWDNSEQGLHDILFHFDEIDKTYNINPKRIVVAGFSQGSGMAIYAALSGKVNTRGFIGVGTFIAEPDSLIHLAGQAGSVRGYFVIGEKDYTLDKARAIQQILKGNDIQFDEDIHSNLGHEFPPDFQKSFDKAIDFIFKEPE